MWNCKLKGVSPVDYSGSRQKCETVLVDGGVQSPSVGAINEFRARNCFNIECVSQDGTRRFEIKNGQLLARSEDDLIDEPF